MIVRDIQNVPCKSGKRPPFECVALLLQGGGALGTYQGGVYQALAEANLHPDWVAGISIGAINAALIAGNPPEARVQSLQKFWQEVTTDFYWNQPAWRWSSLLKNDDMRRFANQMSAGQSITHGIANFCTPSFPTPMFNQFGSWNATHYYDTKKLKKTLERCIDFDRINTGKTRLSVGTTNIITGNLVYFDTTTHTIGPEHIMASGALPPGLPPVKIDGDYYWDGALVSNTPLQWVVEQTPHMDMLIFQLDLWSASGKCPHDMAEVMTCQKEIQFSSRTRAKTDTFKKSHRLQHAFARIFDKLPDELKNSPDAQLLNAEADRKLYNIIHLIYHAKNYEGGSKDYEFSRLSMQDHWQAGYCETLDTLGHPEIFQRPTNPEGIRIYDFSRDEKKAAQPLQEAAE